MKKKIVLSLICGLIFVVLLLTLFWDDSIELILKFKPDLKSIDNDAFEVHFIDVGQGDCVAIRFPNDKTMLIDSGPSNGRDNLEEYLENIFFKDGYNKFDYVFLTHSDVDHSGNMEYILNTFEVGYFYRPHIYSYDLEPNRYGFKVDNMVYDNVLNLIKNKDIMVNFTTDGARIKVGNSIIEMYVSNDKYDETNDYSPIIIISANDSKVCLSGDAGEVVEAEMVSRGILPKVDLLKLAHHGSKYSNSMEFIETLNPTLIACSVGENSHGHPSNDVLLRLANYDEKYGKETFKSLKTTLEHGNLIYYANSHGKMEIKLIGNLGDYLFFDWYGVVIMSEFCVLLYWVLVILPNKPIKLNKHMKNMKQ